MHRVDPQIPGPAARLRLPPLAEGHLYGLRFGVVHPALAVTPSLSQIVNMRHRDRRQPLVGGVSVELPFAFQNLLRRRPAHGFVRFVHLRQQLQVGCGEAARKPVPALAGFLDLAVFPVPANQPRHLRPAQPGHLGHVAPQQPAHRPALRPVVPHPHQPRDPVIDLLPPLPLKVNLLAGFQQRPDLLQAQFLCILHADDQPPACAHPPPGSSCVRNRLTFRLILH